MREDKPNSKPIPSEEKGSSSAATALLKGILAGYAVTCVVFLAYSMLITYTSLSEKHLNIVVAATTLVSVVVAGFDTARSVRGKGWLWGIFAGLVYSLILLVLMTAAQKGFYYDSRTITLIVLSLAGGGLGGVIGINIGGGRK